MKTGMNRKTAGKYLSRDNVLEARRVPHTWKTRKDPLAEIWPKAQEMLQDAPELEAIKDPRQNAKKSCGLGFRQVGVGHAINILGSGILGSDAALKSSKWGDAI